MNQEPSAPVFALNHVATPNLSVAEFFALAGSLGIKDVEIRNDIKGNAILNGDVPEAVRTLADRAGVSIASINALQRFNEWTSQREAEAVALADYAVACGAKALVLCPVNDGSGRANGERQGNLRVALKALKEILESRRLMGFVEPLGFEICSLRSKREVVDAIGAVNGLSTFRLVHDTFHHHLAGEPDFFPALTGLVHISGVADVDITVPGMRDPHRILVDDRDRLGNLDQMRALMAGGYRGLFSFEPFSSTVHNLAEPTDAIASSMNFIRTQLAKKAA